MTGENRIARIAPVATARLAERPQRAAQEIAQWALETQSAATRILACADSLEHALPDLFQLICSNSEFMAAALWSAIPDSDTLNCIHVWPTKSAECARFAAKVRRLRNHLHASPSDDARAQGEPAWASDFCGHPDLRREHFALNAGIRTLVEIPFTVNGVIKGAIDFYGRDDPEPDPVRLKMLCTVAHQIGQFIDREAQQAQIARLNRAHSILSGIRSAIVRIHDQQALFSTVCRVAVADGHFAAACIDVHNPATLEIAPVAWYGFSSEEFSIVDTKTTAQANAALEHEILAQAIRERRPVFSNDITAQLAPRGKRQEEAARYGYRSLIALPLIAAGEVTGALSLFVREAGFFTQEEVRLLTGLAGDLAFAQQYIAQKQQLEQMSNYDALTGLANWHLLSDRLSQAIAQARRRGHMVAVATINLDNFKLINDGLGRNAGDELLRVIAARFKACVREEDMLAHVSGDEFVLALPIQTDVMAVSQVMRRISHTLFTDQRILDRLQSVLSTTAEPIVIEGHDLQLTSSIGVSLYPHDGEDVETLLRNAAAALARAKELGHNNVQFYTRDINASVAKRLSLRSLLRHAVEREEFTLYYQPKINLRSGAVSGVEALLRWNRPGSGVVAPDEFVPMLEETGLIIDVGRWAMETAVNTYGQWRGTAPSAPRIAVNVSPLQLAQKDFPAFIESALKKNGEANGAGLELEITESLIMQDLEENIPKLNAIREMGVAISIDDFGTGYSSLSYLAKLPVTSLKIDRAFIRDMDSSPNGLAIVTTIISLAHSLKLKVVAEGVETASQLNMLRLLKCDEVQGFIVSRPLAREQFAFWRAERLKTPAGGASSLYG